MNEYEKERALLEADMIYELENYFLHRPKLERNIHSEKIFESGFKKGWEANRNAYLVLQKLMPYVIEEYYPNCATPEFKAAVENAKLVLELPETNQPENDSLREVFEELHKPCRRYEWSRQKKINRCGLYCAESA